MILPLHNAGWNQAPHLAAHYIPKARAVQTDAASQPHQAAQDGIEKSRLHQWAWGIMPQRGCFDEQDREGCDEDGGAGVVPHHRRLDHEGQQHHDQGNRPLVQRLGVWLQPGSLESGE
jgi:hypothetical protein